MTPTSTPFHSLFSRVTGGSPRSVLCLCMRSSTLGLAEGARNKWQLCPTSADNTSIRIACLSLAEHGRLPCV